VHRTNSKNIKGSCHARIAENENGEGDFMV
jgi:hypothetical protein